MNGTLSWPLSLRRITWGQWQGRSSRGKETTDGLPLASRSKPPARENVATRVTGRYPILLCAHRSSRPSACERMCAPP